MYITEFINEKEYVSFIKNVEKTVRGCIEYRTWLEYVRDSFNAWKCSISGITTEDAVIEIHHTPYTLFDICAIVIYNQKQKFCTLTIAHEVMQLHFENFVGFVPLTVSNHQRVHSGSLVLSKELIQGGYEHLQKRYTIPKEIEEKIMDTKE